MKFLLGPGRHNAPRVYAIPGLMKTNAIDENRWRIYSARSGRQFEKKKR